MDQRKAYHHALEGHFQEVMIKHNS